MAVAISEDDFKYMRKVALYFCNTKTKEKPRGSIKETATKFDINRNKVRKILVTMGEFTTPISKESIRLREKGLSINEIARYLDVSVATVSTSLPYEDKFDNTLSPTKHTLDVRDYRAYEKKQKKRQSGIKTDERLKTNHTVDSEANSVGWYKEWQKNIENISGNKLLPRPSEVLRLHLELYNDYPGKYDTITLKRFGALKYGTHISRDVIVPSDIPLYALHYVIQRTFGWENSHLRQFQLPMKRFNELCCNNAYMWSRLVGVIFKSPLMDEEDEFWADDYNGGSFKNWLRKKYTGPYLSQCYGEGIISCQRDMMRLDMNKKYYLLYQKSYNLDSGKYDGEEILTMVSEMYDYKGDLNPEPQPWNKCEEYRVEVVPFSDIPSEGLKFLFERDPMALLERLPISAVLSSGQNELSKSCSDEDRVFTEGRIIQTGEELYSFIGDDIKKVLDEQIDSPIVQPYIGPITDELIYNYDFGDGWKVRITASDNCSDLVNFGRITQAELDKANVKCREVYRPVLIERDGEMLMDDVGGLSGFVEFLQDINPDLSGMTPEEKEESKRRKEELLAWAKGMGWHREKVRDFNLL